MKRYLKDRIKGRAGTTLVEMVVTMLLMVIILAMIVGILSPAAKIFIRMQKLQYAQLILDNTAQELRSMAAEAAGYVKIYSGTGTDGVMGRTGTEQGSVLEFLNPEGYAVLISAEGCRQTKILLGDSQIDTVGEVLPGRLFVGYYNTDSATKQYVCRKEGSPVARALSKNFGDGYYMGNYLEISFAYPGGIASGDPVTYLEAKLYLYNHEDRAPEHLVAQEEVMLDFRYGVQRYDEVTAVDGPDAVP